MNNSVNALPIIPAPAVRTIDQGKIRLGAGCRILVAQPKRTADTGRIRFGAGCRIRTAGKTSTGRV